MGRKSINKSRKPITAKVKTWLEALLLKIQDKDLEHLTIDDFAKLAGKSKSTVYVYFESKEEILLSACQLRIETLIQIISESYQQNLDTKNQYETLMHKFAEGTAGISIYFLQSIKQNYPSVWNVIENFTDQFIELLKVQYEKGISEGVFNDIPIELTIVIDKIFVMQVVTNAELFHDKSYPVSQLIEDYLNLRLNGLLKK